MADKKISALAAATTPLAGTEMVPIVQGGATVKATVESVAATTQPSGIANAVQFLNGSKVSSTSSRLIFDNSAYQTLTTQTYVNGGYVNARTAPSNGTYNTYDFVEGATTTGYLRNYGSAFGAGVSNVLHLFNTQNAPLGFGTNNTLQVEIDTSGNLVPKVAAKGINFTANTPAAGMTSQLLNWYEEGTWTPNQGAGLTVVGAFSSTGTYTRIGRQVMVRGQVAGATSVAVSASGVISSNLPFTAAVTHAGSMVNDAVNSSGVVQITSTSVVAAGAIAATLNITFTAIYTV